jgi:hypothetical protein
MTLQTSGGPRRRSTELQDPCAQGAFVDYLAAAPAGGICPCLVRSDIGNTPTKPNCAWTSICVASAQTVSLDPTSGHRTQHQLSDYERRS